MGSWIQIGRLTKMMCAGRPGSVFEVPQSSGRSAMDEAAHTSSMGAIKLVTSFCVGAPQPTLMDCGVRFVASMSVLTNCFNHCKLAPALLFERVTLLTWARGHSWLQSILVHRPCS